MKLSEIVVEGAIRPNMEATDRDSAVAELVDALAEVGAFKGSLRDDILTALLERERRGSTGFGRGVAVPHVKHSAIKKMVAAVGISQAGIDFNALDKQPVFSIFLLLSPDGEPEEHLKAMEVIFGSLSQETFRKFLRQTESVEEIVSLIAENDSSQVGG
ncbi:MAG: PTS sugar transporter subunit IIA [Phycisphaerales bacterium]|nr:PTS sugar transporter subunit IIA [Phycisphaerales bacterium]